MLFSTYDPLKSKIITDNSTDNKLAEQLNQINFLGCRLSHLGETDLQHKLARFNQMSGAIL